MCMLLTQPFMPHGSYGWYVVYSDRTSPVMVCCLCRVRDSTSPLAELHAGMLCTVTMIILLSQCTVTCTPGLCRFVCVRVVVCMYDVLHMYSTYV